MNNSPTSPGGSRQPQRPRSSSSKSSKSRRPSAQDRPAPRPSPLSQMVSPDTIQRPFSVAPSVASLTASEPRGDVTLVEDPVFWKRFSQAIHEADSVEELKKKEKEDNRQSKFRPNRVSGFSGRDSWLHQQRKEKRRCRLLCVLIIALAIAVIVAVIIVCVVIKPWS